VDEAAGIAGFQLADVNAGGGQTVDQQIVFARRNGMTPSVCCLRSNRLELEMTIFSSAGWSETGGPWVKPEQAMRNGLE